MATALGEVFSPEGIKRGGTVSKTDKAFDRYYQPHRREHLKVISAIKDIRKNANGDLIDFRHKSEQ